MRPVEIGIVPTDDNGQPKQYSEYQQARPDLIKRLGEYCSFCEGRIAANLALEHILPKSLHPQLALSWDNFLIACTNCNSTKGSQNIDLKDYYWPHQDNTARAFVYQRGGLVSVNKALKSFAQNKAQRTLELTGLNKIGVNSTISDRRWMSRRDTWNIAQRARQNLLKNNTPEMREQIVETTLARGFWSIWMTVFQDDVDMLNRFIQVFPGTCCQCFNQQGQAVHRQGGAL
ncbi:MAG: HNH endonuclease [Candidatus Parabeggiatoa sp.]|nr:HNH endonuclease [Candidatus Parabeggiatoa sp.]